MTRLSIIRRGLDGLRRRRASIRWGTAVCGLAIAALCILAGAFLLDWTLKMSVPQRVVALALYIGLLAWAVRRWVRPWLGHRETEVDMALLVEKHQKIDSELVAALQFESPDAQRWGSTQLQSAVIDYVADFGRNWNFLEGLPTAQLRKRIAILAGLAIAATVWAVVFPAHSLAFLQRLCLADVKYPSTTHIAQVVVIGGDAPLSLHDDSYRGPFGKTITFEIHATGVLPDDGQIKLGSLAGESWEPLTLHKVSRSKEKSTDEAVYEAKLPRLLESIHFQAVLNDDYTKELPVVVLALPVVQASLTSTPPSYAQGDEKADTNVANRQLSVLEGSSVDLQITCANKKLKSASLRIMPALAADAPLGDMPAGDVNAAGSKTGGVPASAPTVKPAADAVKPAAGAVKPAAGAVKVAAALPPKGQTFPLTKTLKNGREVWTLDAKNTPFARVAADLRYEIAAVDEDDLTPEQPLQGTVRVRPDQKPSVTGDAITLYVLPTGTPRISYNAQDDFAISELKLHLEVTHEGTGESGSGNQVSDEKGPDQPASDKLASDKASDNGALSAAKKAIAPIVIRKKGAPLLRKQMPLKGEFSLNLAPYHLAKGDQVKVTLEVVDYRGEGVPGESGLSEPLVFHVTDESGIYAVTSESDERGARNIDNINKLQLGIGGSK
ncbi:MAG TPA: hypothetical protein VFE24_16485 [Pirellulales bacterium]|jgi:hypothetical protein|nr:hypothetical protein [Pirellulales bacterium]